jgi:hypothetical protein
MGEELVCELGDLSIRFAPKAAVSLAHQPRDSYQVYHSLRIYHNKNNPKEKTNSPIITLNY